MADTTNLTLPLLAASQAQKHVTVNEALSRLDGMVQLRLLSISTATPERLSIALETSRGERSSKVRSKTATSPISTQSGTVCSSTTDERLQTRC